MEVHKLLILGEAKTGKTSVITSFIGESANVVGRDFVLKILHFGDKKVRLQLWDVAGSQNS